jgi:hypothetical protein
MKQLKKVECQFNIFNEGREYTGNHRSYVLENAKNICTAPATKEKIKLREALGYYGHGRRILAKKMDLGEVEAIIMPDGSKMVVSNIPSNVTTAFSVGDDGTVIHSQEILDTETGRIVAELNKSKVGGFSWACPGRDDGAVGATRLTGFAGFDYVLNPGFAMNRGYVLESAGEDAVDRDAILESLVMSTEMDSKVIESLFDGWSAQAQLRAIELESRLEDAEIYETAMLVKMADREVEFSDLDENHKTAVLALEKEKADRKALIDFVIESSPFFIPENIQHAMMENDIDTARPIFESAKKVDFGQLPIGDNPATFKKIEINPRPEVVKTEAGWNL